MLTYKPCGNPIARIVSTEENTSQMLYIDRDSCDEPIDDFDELVEDDDFLSSKNGMLSQETQKIILEGLKNGIDINDMLSAIKPHYKRLQTKKTESIGKELKLPTGKFTMIMPSVESERVFVAGRSGMGKSTVASRFAMEYQKMHPDNNICVFSRHDEDPAYDGIDFEQITLSPEILEADIGIEELKDSLVIFDDCDNLQDKDVSNFVHKLVDDLISNGRKKNITILYLGHQLMNYTKTRNLLNESNRVIFFNNGTSYHIRKFLQTYAGLEKEVIAKIQALKSRWVCICLCNQPYVLHETGAFIL